MGQSVKLSANGNGDTYLWDNGTPGPSITVTPSVTTQYSVTATIASNGCTSTAFVTQQESNCSGVGNTDADRLFALFPNPVSGTLFVGGEIHGTFFIYSQLGQKVGEGKLHGASQGIDMRQLPAGVYIVSIRSYGNNSFYRVIKE